MANLLAVIKLLFQTSPKNFLKHSIHLLWIFLDVIYQILPKTATTAFKWLYLFFKILPKGVWSGDWGVTFKSQCALKETSVVIKCEYDYPLGHLVTSVSWSKAQQVSGKWRLFPLSNLPSPPNHIKYVGNYWGDCSLEINDLQHTDEGHYFFSFATTFNRWRSKTSAHLSVKGNDKIMGEKNVMN